MTTPKLDYQFVSVHVNYDLFRNAEGSIPDFTNYMGACIAEHWTGEDEPVFATASLVKIDKIIFFFKLESQTEFEPLHIMNVNVNPVTMDSAIICQATDVWDDIDPADREIIVDSIQTITIKDFQNSLSQFLYQGIVTAFEIDDSRMIQVMGDSSWINREMPIGQAFDQAETKAQERFQRLVDETRRCYSR